MNNNTQSLIHLMGEQEAEDFIKRMETKKGAVKQDKINLMNAAKEYGEKYKDQIERGTHEKQLLLEDGKRRGLTTEETLRAMTKFIPAQDTPILNLLYFMMNENPGVNNDIKSLREETNINKDFELLKEQMNGEFGNLTLDFDQDLPELLEFVYKNVTLNIFNKIKKLKALTYSPNDAEAKLAFEKCRELCKKYNLDMARIPCELETKRKE